MNPFFVCIGTDRSTGDSFGPLVGSALEALGYDVIGTIDDTVHGANLHERLKEIPEDRTVIAVDACLGNASSVGTLKWEKGPLQPGAGVGKTDLPAVGAYHLKGIVNVGGFMEYFVLQNTRLSLVMKMAREAVQLIQNKFPLEVDSHDSKKFRPVNRFSRYYRSGAVVHPGTDSRREASVGAESAAD